MTHMCHRVRPYERTSDVFVGQAQGGTAYLETQRDGAALRLLPRLLAAEGGEIEVWVVVVEVLDAAPVRGVRVEHLVAVLQKGADPGHLHAAHARRPRAAGP